jgi:hypothetical protein
MERLLAIHWGVPPKTPRVSFPIDKVYLQSNVEDVYKPKGEAPALPRQPR